MANNVTYIINFLWWNLGGEKSFSKSQREKGGGDIWQVVLNMLSQPKQEKKGKLPDMKHIYVQYGKDGKDGKVKDSRA